MAAHRAWAGGVSLATALVFIGLAVTILSVKRIGGRGW